MSLDQFMQYSTGGTALNEQTSPGSAIEFSQSPLIEDSETNKFFSTFFGSTSLHQDPQRVDPFGFNQQSEGMHTPLLNEGLLVTVRAWRAKSHLIEERNPFNRSNDDRLTLLARKYVAQESFPDETIWAKRA